MRSALLASIAVLVLTGGCSQKSEESRPSLSGHVSYTAPAGWKKAEQPFGADFTVNIAKDAYEFRIQLLGGEGSLFTSAEELIASFQTPPSKLQTLKPIEVSGKQAARYSNKYRMTANDPHGEARDRYVYEEFCVLPAGKRFLVVGGSKHSFRKEISSPCLRNGEPSSKA